MKNAVSLLLSLMPLCIYAQMDAEPQEFFNVKIGGGGFVTGVISSPAQEGVIYLRTDVGGAYRWNVSAGKWEAMLDWNSSAQWTYQGVLSICADPNDADKVYMLVGLYNNSPTAVLRSDDGGRTFEEARLDIKVNGNAVGRGTGERLAVDPNCGDILFCGTQSNGLYRSDDAGVSWTRVESFPILSTSDGNGIDIVIFDKASGKVGGATPVVYVACSDSEKSLFVSDDGGDTWKQIEIPTPASGLRPQHGVLTPDGSTLYLSMANGAGPHGSGNDWYDTGAIMKYDTESGSWNNVTPPFKSAYSAISLDPNNQERLLVSTINSWNNRQVWDDGQEAWGDRVFLTEDGGRTWNNILDASGARFYAGDFPWVRGLNLHWCSSLVFDAYDSEKFYITSGNGVFCCRDISSDGKLRKVEFWSNGLEETVPLDFISIVDGPLLSVVGDYDGFVHDDIFTSPQSGRHRPSVGTSSAVASDSYGNVFVRARSTDDNPKFYRSVDKGLSWTGFDAPGDAQMGYCKMAVSNDGKSLLVVSGDSDKLFFTDDWGNSWSELASANISGTKPIASLIENNKWYIADKTGALKTVFYDGSELKVEKSAIFGSTGILQIEVVRQGDVELVYIPMRNGGIGVWDGKVMSYKMKSLMCSNISAGKNHPDSSYPTFFVYGKLDGKEGIFRTTDDFETLVMVSDDAHRYGGLGNASMIEADQNVFGRVYLSSWGRGILGLQPAGTSDGIEAVNVDSDEGMPLVVFDTVFEKRFGCLTDFRVYDMSGRMIDCFYGECASVGNGYPRGKRYLAVERVKNKLDKAYYISKR